MVVARSNYSRTNGTRTSVESKSNRGCNHHLIGTVELCYQGACRRHSLRSGGVAAWYRRVVHRLITSSSSQTATAEVRRRGGDRRRHEQRRDAVRSTVAVSGFGHSSARRNCDTKQIDAALILIIIIIIIIIPMTKFIVLSSKQTKTHTIKHETILKRTKITRN